MRNWFVAVLLALLCVTSAANASPNRGSLMLRAPTAVDPNEEVDPANPLINVGSHPVCDERSCVLVPAHTRRLYRPTPSPSGELKRYSLWFTAGVGVAWSTHEAVPDFSFGLELQVRINHRFTWIFGGEVSAALLPTVLEFPLFSGLFIEVLNDKLELAPLAVMAVVGNGGDHGVRSLILGPAFSQIFIPGKLEVTYAAGFLVQFLGDSSHENKPKDAGVHALEIADDEMGQGGGPSANQERHALGFGGFISVSGIGAAWGSLKH